MIKSYTQRFSNDTDAIEYADAHDIPRSRIYYRGNDPCIDIPVQSPPSMIKKDSPSSTRLSSKDKKYTGIAYVTALMSSGRYWFDSKTKNNPKTYELSSARIHKTLKAARDACRYSSSENKIILEVDAKEGVATRIRREVK